MLRFKDFLHDRAGNFAAMTVLASIPMLGGVALSVEYANISRAQSNLQNAVDAAVLSAARYHKTNGKLPEKNDAKKMLLATFDGKVIGFDIKVVADQLFVSATADTPPFFFGKVAPDLFHQTADATVPINQIDDVEVALVLDNTYSMSADGKMDSLKTVAKEFIDDLSTTIPSGKLKIGLVPFTNHVNVGLANRKASWIDVPDDETKTEFSCQMETVGATPTNCRMETVIWDGVATQQNVCDWVGGTTQEVCKDRTTTSTWQGCVGSRQAPYTLKDNAPNVRFNGLMNVWCGEEIKPLTDDFASLKTAVDSMWPTQDTYIAPGVMWGLRVLSNAQPFSEAKPAGKDRKKIMILMTDGDNQRSANLPWDPANWGTDLVQANDWSKDACKEARDAGITIYSIAFGTTVSAAGKAVMQDCATEASGYYDAKDASALKKAFDDIAAQISRIRLSS